MNRFLFLVIGSLLSFNLIAMGQNSTPTEQKPAAPEQSVEQRVKALHAVLDLQWEFTLRTNPEFASIIGDKRYNDKLSDLSQPAIDRDLRQARIFLRDIEAIDPTGFPEQERLNRDLMVRNLREKLERARFKDWEMPVNQFNGVHINMPQLVTSLSFDSVKDYTDYIARLNQLPVMLDQTILQMRKGMRDKLMPPKILLMQVVEQTNAIAKQKAEDTPFAQPLSKFPKDMPAIDQSRIRAGVLAAIQNQVLPAYAKFERFVRDEYAPAGSMEIGMSA